MDAGAYSSLATAYELRQHVVPRLAQHSQPLAPSQHALRLAELLLACPATSECVACVPWRRGPPGCALWRAVHVLCASGESVGHLALLRLLLLRAASASPALLREAAREALREAAFRDRVLVLEYLRGPEVGLCGQDASRCSALLRATAGASPHAIAVLVGDQWSQGGQAEGIDGAAWREVLPTLLDLALQRCALVPRFHAERLVFDCAVAAMERGIVEEALLPILDSRCRWTPSTCIDFAMAASNRGYGRVACLAISKSPQSFAHAPWFVRQILADACRKGLACVVWALGSSPYRWNASDDLLVLACAGGHVGTMRVLAQPAYCFEPPAPDAPSDPALALYHAAFVDDAPRIRALTSQRPSRPSPSSSSSPASPASSTSSPSTPGVDVDALVRGNTALAAACHAGNLGAVGALLAAGASVALRNASGASALFYAADTGNALVVAALVAAGADVRSPCGPDGQTALHVASNGGHAGAVRALLAAGADPNAQRESDSATPLFFACQSGHTDVVEALVDAGADVDAQEARAGVSALFAAAAAGDARSVQLLVRSGAAVDARCYDGSTALLAACRRGSLAAVRALLAAGAGPDEADSSSTRPLFVASACGHRDVVAALLAAGAHVDRKCAGCATALHAASGAGHRGVVEELLRAGACANERAGDGVTPLHAACAGCHVGVVRALLRAGADPNGAPAQPADSLCGSGVRRGAGDVEDIGRGRCAARAASCSALGTPLMIACERGSKEAIGLLLRAGADVDAPVSPDGVCPLLVAAGLGLTDVVELLVGAGADVDRAETALGMTPLIVAASKGHAAVVRALVMGGAALEVADRDRGLTALETAAFFGFADVVEALVQAGAVYNRANNQGATPLLLAAFMGNTSVCHLLASYGERFPAAWEQRLRQKMGREQFDALYVQVQRLAAKRPRKRPPVAPARSPASAGGSRAARQPRTNRDVTPAAAAPTPRKPQLQPRVDTEVVFRAVEDGGREAIRSAVAAWPGAADCPCERTGETPLLRAVQLGNVDAVEELLAAGADANRGDAKSGATPLLAAVAKGFVRVAEALVAAGARPSQRAAAGETALHVAARQGSRDLVALLARGAGDGALLGLQNDEGETPLLCAVRAGAPLDVVDALCAACSVDAEGKRGDTPLTCAVGRRSAALVDALVRRGCSVDRRPSTGGGTALSVAAATGDTAVVDCLLRAGASVDGDPERCPLLAACAHGHLVVAQKLLERGANVDAASPEGETPLIAASARGHTDIVEALVRSRAALDAARRDDGATALLLAGSQGHTAAVRALLRGGAAVDRARSTDGATALYAAAMGGHGDAFAALVEAGAAVDRRTAQGTSFLWAAADAGAAAAVALLVGAGAAVDRRSSMDETTPLHAASRRGHAEVVRALLDAGAGADRASTVDGATPLIAACERGHAAVVDALLRAGADASRATGDGTTALLRASANGHVEVVRLLVAAGADVDAAHRTSAETPLFVASMHGHCEVVVALLEAGSDVARATAGDGSTAITIAALNGHVGVCKALAAHGATFPQRWRAIVKRRLKAPLYGKLCSLSRQYGAQRDAGSSVGPGEAAAAEVPREYVCPITMDLMADPVFAEDGFVYEGAAIRRWLGSHGTSPMTGAAMGATLVPCHTLRSAIASFREGERQTTTNV
eukprot:m51a1_g10684 hypothetical protein (1658) ;mRNA; r:98094-104684